MFGGNIGLSSRQRGCSTLQSESQPSWLRRLPSSHVSSCARSVMPFPHVSFDEQSLAQPSPLIVLPSSQASGGSVRPLPQPFGRHTPSWHVLSVRHASRSGKAVHAAD